MSALNGRLSGLVANVLDLPLAEVGEARAEVTPSWDSFGHLRLVMAVEEEFGVSFSPEEIVQLDSVERIGDALERLMAARA